MGVWKDVGTHTDSMEGCRLSVLSQEMQCFYITEMSCILPLAMHSNAELMLYILVCHRKCYSCDQSNQRHVLMGYGICRQPLAQAPCPKALDRPSWNWTLPLLVPKFIIREACRLLFALLGGMRAIHKHLGRHERILRGADTGELLPS